MSINRLLTWSLTCFFLCGKLMGQQPYWQQKADYRMEVSLHPADHSLQGTAAIRYQNNSTDTLRFIWFHCWPNAYRNDKTAFSEQLLQLNRTDFYFSADTERGYLNQLVMKVDGQVLQTEQDPQYQDISKLVLLQPLPPGQAITINAGFHVQLPRIFSRMGYRQGFYAITQWYPKPAVYDARGWHPMPYLDQGEFYSEYGDYEVKITVPAGYTIAATGLLTDSSLAAGQTTYQFSQQNIHDFAWFASRKFKVSQDTLRSIDGRIIELRTYVLPGHEQQWSRSMDYLKSAIHFRESLIGPYPYPVAQVVDGFQGEGGGGMEYPTITVLNEITDDEELRLTIEHEIGHNWFYGALGTNERDFPWMDEGLNTYYDQRYEKQYAARTGNKKQKQLLEPDAPESWLISGLESIHRDQPINTPASRFNKANYGLVPYYKTALWLEKLAAAIGQSTLDSAIRIYYKQYTFRHPQPEDFQRVILGLAPAAAPYFDLLDRTGPLNPSVKKSIKPVFLLDASGQQQYQTIGLGPLPGYNFYDGFQLGLFIHNYQLPLPGFRFFIAPMYGTKSKSLTGLAHLDYHYYPQGTLQQVEAGMNLMRFSGNETELMTRVSPLHFEKIQPYLKLSLKQPDPLSKKETWLRVSSFFFREEQLSAKEVINGADTTIAYSKTPTSRQLQQATLFLANYRKLYPYSLEAKLEYCSDFTRLAVTGNYFFNYPGKNQGLQVRAFAGKFFYNGERTALKALELDRYQLNLTGANGYEDYTYSNYFAGRNRFDGWMSQQIMMRDGGFKVRTDLYSEKIGKSDNWLAALNFTSTIPDRINPLSLLPVHIPVKLFADLGTFAEAWTGEQNQDRFLFDAGIQLSLLHNLVNIYLPVVNSKVFRDYNQSTLGKNKWLKTISFSIDIQQLSANKWLAKAGL